MTKKEQDELYNKAIKDLTEEEALMLIARIREDVQEFDN